MICDKEDKISARKEAHLALCLEPSVRGQGAGLDDIQLPYDALFSLSEEELDTRRWIGGREIRFPLMIGAMTGGTPKAAEFNTVLRGLAHRYGLAMELGSIRCLLKHPDLLSTYGTGDVEALFANIGASEIHVDCVNALEECCKRLGASGLCIHLNGLQEWVQEEGNHSFCCRVNELSSFIEQFKLPVIVKEVGSGIGGHCAEVLSQLPILGIETASLGGTSWVAIEGLRRKQSISEANMKALRSIGYDLVTSIRECRRALGPERIVIASGGISSSLDVIKSLYLGANMAAVAQPLYEAYHSGGAEGVEMFLSEWIEVGKLIWRSTGMTLKMPDKMS